MWLRTAPIDDSKQLLWIIVDELFSLAITREEKLSSMFDYIFVYNVYKIIISLVLSLIMGII